MKRKDNELYEDSFAKYGIIRQGSVSRHFHYHAELILSFEGGFDAAVDGEHFYVNEGTGVIVFPYQLHEYFAVDSKRALVLLFHPERNQRYYEYFKGNLPKSAHIPAEIIDDEVRAVSELIIKHAGLRHKTKFSGELLEIYKEAVFGLILEKLELEPTASGQIDLLRRVVHWCQEHYTEQVTIPVAARALAISESQLSHLFSCKLHTGFRDYINSLRVQAAIELLLKTRKPISEIAFDCGFVSFSTFNRAFLKSTGLTPREVRERGNLELPGENERKK